MFAISLGGENSGWSPSFFRGANPIMRAQASIVSLLACTFAAFPGVALAQISATPEPAVVAAAEEYNTGYAAAASPVLEPTTQPGLDYFAPQAESESLPSDVAAYELSAASSSNAEMAPADAAKKQADLKKAVGSAYAPLFFNNKFDYINNPLYSDWYPGDALKRMPVGDCMTLDIGGQYRMRQHSERNFRGLGLTGRDDDFLLHRTRLFANLTYGDHIRVYAEAIDADSNYENFAPRPIEVNRADMLNLFVDFKLFDCDTQSLTARVGRQELLYGSQRLVSPLDWANTRRTFEGLNFLWRGEDWNADFFYVEPVQTDPVHFDSAIDEQEFLGVYATYKAIKDQTIDLFALQYNNASAPKNFQYTTLGSRWQGSVDSWLWETEGGVQFGENSDGSDHSAGYWTLGGGRKFDHCWKPTLWVYYDWASGGDVLGAGNGFDHLFPLAHKYLGFMDLFARSNIESPNVQLTFSPREKINMTVWYHYLFLETTGDTPYNVNMTPFKSGNAPPSSDLGHEIDFTVQYVINPRMDVLFGYSHFFAGDYYKLSPVGPVAPSGTPGVPYAGDASFFYTQFTWNF